MASRKKNKLEILAVVWLLLGVVVALVTLLVFMFFIPEKNYDYRGYPIRMDKCVGSVVECTYVTFTIRGTPYEISFYHHPNEVENIPVQAEAMLAIIGMQNISNHTVYIAMPADAPGQIGIAGTELARIMGARYNIMNLNVRGALYGEGGVTCEDANKRTLILVIKQGSVNAAGLAGPNCVVVSATNSTNAVMVADALAYHLLGVIPSFKTEPTQ